MVSTVYVECLRKSGSDYLWNALRESVVDYI